MANYSSLKDFYETFKNELSSDDYEYCEEETKADDLKEDNDKKNTRLEFVEVHEANTKSRSPILISSSSSESTASSIGRRKKFTKERTSKMMISKQPHIRKIEKGVHKEFRSQRGRIIQKSAKSCQDE